MSFTFHAAAQQGEWLNDPNGLVFVDGHYLLFAQHSLNGPNGHDVGWGRFKSDNLLAWTWDGVAIEPSGKGSAYSGCLVQSEDGIEAFYTRHDPICQVQTQHSAAAPEFRNESDKLGPEGRDCRDPFVHWCAATGDWRMLIALPCSWTGAADDPPSILEIWCSPDRITWALAGEIGPWHPPGVMWEVPVLVTIDGTDVLVMSLVDRRDGATDCSVHYWLGAFDGMRFSVAAGFPAEGVRLDHGPDFYAAIANLSAGWPDTSSVIIGWASNWQAARTRKWHGGSRGGPISLPRSVVIRGHRLCQSPVPVALDLPHTTGCFSDRLTHGTLTVTADRVRGQLRVQTLDFDGASAVDWAGVSSTYRMFEDNGLVELFIEPEGVTVTAALGV